MNAPLPDSARDVIGENLFAEARRLAPTRGHSIVATLEELTGLGPQEFTVQLARTLHLPWAHIQDLHGWQPAFDVLSFQDALQA
ncbi:MAG: type II/IV secretion system protein, partial [Ramlibacter sp.]